MAKKKCPECTPGAPKWMATFSDLVTLLMTFFVLLITMASFDKIKFEQMFSVLTGSQGILDLAGDSDFSQVSVVSTSASNEQSIETTEDQIEQTVKDYVNAQNLENMISVIKTDKGISIRIMDSVFFASGSSTLLPAASPILNTVINLVKDTNYYINIEGHTDDVPIGNNPALNWDLSVDRAVAVVKYFADSSFNPIRLSASGYGQFHPLLPNITNANRSKNRRVEINIISPEFAETGANIFQ